MQHEVLNSASELKNLIVLTNQPLLEIISVKFRLADI